MTYHLITGKTANLRDDAPKIMARGRTEHVPGKMNKEEAAYAWELDMRIKAGEIAWYAFEPMRLKLADRTTYTPDFLIMYQTGAMEFVEVKGGHWEDDARVKLKVAAETYWMFRFRVVRKGHKDEVFNA